MNINYLTNSHIRPPVDNQGSPITKILVPGSWYQDLGTKKNGEPERRSLSVCRGARGAAGAPPGGLGGWKPPQEQQGVWGGGSPSKNNFMDPDSKISCPKINFMGFFRAMPCHYFFRANIFRAVPCQDFPCRHFPGRAVP